MKSGKYEFEYGYWYANLSLIITMVVTYSVISPIMLFFGLIYFVLASIIFKYLLMTFYKPTNSIARHVWSKALPSITVSLYIPIVR